MTDDVVAVLLYFAVVTPFLWAYWRAKSHANAHAEKMRQYLERNS